uniref:Anillin domain-containing protein n=2 Tax=Mesocestoides corti TaxID=53468 RepID=A0A5K3F5U4_MESCO
GAVFFNRPAKFKFSLRLFCRSQLSTPDFLVEMTKLPRQNTMSKDPKLQEDIERNLKLREGASRILAMAANNIQRLDAAKTILVSNARLVVSMQQLQREKTSEANAAARGQVPSLLSNSTNHFCTGKATLCLSDLRIPLLWKDTTLTPNSSVTLAQVLDPGYLSSSPAPSGYSSATLSRQRPLSAVISMATAGALTGGDVAGEAYSAFCIVRVADQVRETRLLCDVFPGSADLEFDDVLTFKNIGPDFECTIEVYGSQPFCGQNGSAFLRRKSQIDSISAANRNSIFLGTLTPEYTKVSKSGQRGAVSAHSQIADCCFTLVARYSARLSDLSSGVSAHALEFLLTPSHHPSQSGVNSLLSIPAFPTNDDILPLFGPICFRMSAQPDSAHKSVRQGLLWIRTLNASPKQEVAQLYFCELRNQRLYARLVKSKDRSALSSDNPEITANAAAQTDSVLRRLRQSSSAVGGGPLSKQDLVIKVEPSMEILDDEPVRRAIFLSSEAFTLEEWSYFLSKRTAGPRRSASTGLLPSTMHLTDNGNETESDRVSPTISRQWSLCNQVMTTEGFEKQMATLHLVSRLCGERELEAVFEIAAFDPLFFVNAEELEDSGPLNDWLCAIREHLEEQVSWGVDIFGHEISIPEATSLTKHGTIIRASTIPEVPSPPLGTCNNSTTPITIH